MQSYRQGLPPNTRKLEQASEYIGLPSLLFTALQVASLTQATPDSAEFRALIIAQPTPRLRVWEARLQQVKLL